MGVVKKQRVDLGERGLLPEVAYHFLQAGEWADAVRYHRLAGDLAQDTLAYQEAATFYQTAIRLLQEHPELVMAPGERAGLYEAQALTLETLGQSDEALAAFQAAQAAAGEDRVRWAWNERNIAWYLCRRGKLDEAAASCERARIVLEVAGADELLADTLRTLGIVEIYQGHCETARAHLQRALSLYQKREPGEGLARCYQHLALLCQHIGDIEGMLEAVQQGHLVAVKLGHAISIGQALNNVAWVLILLGRDEESLPLLFQALEIFEQHHVAKNLPNVYHSLAQALIKCGRAHEAQPYLERGLNRARRIGATETVVDFRCLWARQAAAADRSDESRCRYEEAIESCSEGGLESRRAQICLELGEFLESTGNARAAVHFFEEALAIRRRLDLQGVEEAEAAVIRTRDAARNS